MRKGVALILLLAVLISNFSVASAAPPRNADPRNPGGGGGGISTNWGLLKMGYRVETRYVSVVRGSQSAATNALSRDARVLSLLRNGFERSTITSTGRIYTLKLVRPIPTR